MTASFQIPCKKAAVKRFTQMIAIVFLIAIQIFPSYADTWFKEQVDGFFGWIGKSIKNFVGDDFSDDQTGKINETIDTGVNAGSISVEMFKAFHDFVVSIVLMVASLLGVEIGETIAFIIGVIAALFIVGLLLRKFIFDSWKIILAILAILAVLLLFGVVMIDV